MNELYLNEKDIAWIIEMEFMKLDDFNDDWKKTAKKAARIIMKLPQITHNLTLHP